MIRGVGSKFGLVRQILGQISQHSVQLQVHSMRSMQMLGGSGGMPPQENLKNGCSEIEDSSVQCTIVHD